MLLSEKHIFKNDKLNMTILQHMGYSAYKLWNVGNYEKRNYEKLGMKKFPVKISHLKLHKIFYNYYRRAGRVTLLKTERVKNPKPPRFRREVMDITFLKDAIKQVGDTLLFQNN